MPKLLQQQQQPSSSDLFKIPILPPPLLPTWNIPAPVIHPPGSDPGQHQVVLRTVSLMDVVDPCVMVSRREEIVAKEVDLTASEHAGIILSEATTMVPTSSVVVPQTVKDVIVSETESKTENFMGCDVDNVTCHSDEAFTKHIKRQTLSSVANDMLGQESEKKKKNKDLEITKKVLVSTVIEQQTPSSVSNATSDQESERKKNEYLWQKEAADGSLFVCDIPEPGIDYPKIATVEMDEAFFKNQVPNHTSVSTQNRPAKLSGHKPIWCDICKVKCDTGKTFDQHIAGKQHQKKLKISEILKSTESEIGNLEDSKTTWCGICKVSCSSNSYKEHTSGMKHRNNLQKLEIMQKLPSTVIDSVTAPSAEKHQSLNFVGFVVNQNEGNFATCKLCGVRCTSVDMFNKHIPGKKHQKNLKKSGNQCVPTPAPVAKTQLSGSMIEEGEVVLLNKSKRMADDPLGSDDAADTKRQKTGEEEGRGVLVICKVCNVGCNGLMAFNTHLASFEHLRMALRHARGGSNGLQV